MEAGMYKWCSVFKCSERSEVSERFQIQWAIRALNYTFLFHEKKRVQSISQGKKKVWSRAKNVKLLLKLLLPQNIAFRFPLAWRQLLLETTAVTQCDTAGRLNDKTFARWVGNRRPKTSASNDNCQTTPVHKVAATSATMWANNPSVRGNLNGIPGCHFLLQFYRLQFDANAT